MREAPRADICLLLEGSYPFVAGGVSAWTHDLIAAQGDLSFAILAITADEQPRRPAYQLPPNVVDFRLLPLNQTPRGRAVRNRHIGEALIAAMLAFQRDGSLERLYAVLRMTAQFRGRVLPTDVLDSEGAWRAIERGAREEMPETSFLHYFWSLRSLTSAFLATVLAPLPDAGVYHAVSTGYAGLLAARARIEYGRPALLTEHGIYTNERRIEIASADWLHERMVPGLVLEPGRRTLKDLWTDCFAAYARASYAAVSHIVTLFRGNQEMEVRDGAPVEKCLVIPNGIDVARYGRLARPAAGTAPTIALIGRVVPIKDIKTYIRACQILKERFPDLQAFVMGPTDEDPGYYAECVAMARELNLERTLRFTGRVDVERYLPAIHINVLTSLSEAQPLVVLETGAAGIPTVATDVGACREMILGMENETPALGAGGAVAPLGDPTAIAEAVARLLDNRAALDAASQAARARIGRYYTKVRMDASYRHLYEMLLHGRGAGQARPGPQRRAAPRRDAWRLVERI